MEKNKKIENRLVSTIRVMLYYVEDKTEKENILNNVSTLLQDAEVDSKIIVNVLEQFGKEGKEEALAIKVNEGW